MDFYIDTIDARKILFKIKDFESDLKCLYEKWNYDFRTNLGRRNALVSMSQEIETAKILSEKFKGVKSDGAPGKPDIIIEELNAELECKLTSGSRSGNNFKFDFKTDWETICNKEKLDYIYILADENFEKFAFLFFKGLTPLDFFKPASGSRGKSRMNKSLGMQKCTPLFGDFANKSKNKIEELNLEISNIEEKHDNRILEISNRKANTEKQKIKIMNLIDSENLKFNNKISKLSNQIKFWEESPDNFTFILDPLV
jgi:hypothetical protein